MKGKKIILGVSGSIAAYKAAFLVRLLVKQGAEVKVLMTKSAQTFISPLTLSTLSNNEVVSSVSDEHSWNNHVDLGLWADAYIIAPATAQTIARLANGLCDDMLSAVYLSARCPVFVAPAMDLDMWTHPATQRNIDRLHADKCMVIDPENGELASGLVGKGRLAEPEHIVEVLNKFFTPQSTPLTGKSVLITAGPTHEQIDPVRFIGNNSTGKMGIAIADEAARRGASVTLLLGPTHLMPTDARVKVIHTPSAEEMYTAATLAWPKTDIGIMAAAVADYRPAVQSTEKIKKKEQNLTIELLKTPDIAGRLGQLKSAKQLLIGFALETNNENEHARLKLETKNFDFIVLNSMQDAGAGFGHDTNKVTFISKTYENAHPLQSKTAVAALLLDQINSHLLT